MVKGIRMGIEDLGVSLFADDPRYDDMNPNEGHFSWSACDCCGDSLGGMRYDIVGLNPGDNRDEMIELSVCEDCYVELVS